MKPTTPLKRAIFESAWTQRALADAVGLREDQMSRIANGLHCDTATRDAIAEKLERPVAALWPSPAEDVAA